jgi:hypothetical protein
MPVFERGRRCSWIRRRGSGTRQVSFHMAGDARRHWLLSISLRMEDCVFCCVCIRILITQHFFWEFVLEHQSQMPTGIDQLRAKQKFLALVYRCKSIRRRIRTPNRDMQTSHARFTTWMVPSDLACICSWWTIAVYSRFPECLWTLVHQGRPRWLGFFFFACEDSCHELFLYISGCLTLLS